MINGFDPNQVFNETSREIDEVYDPNRTYDLNDSTYTDQHYYGVYKSRVVDDDSVVVSKVKSFERKPIEETASYVDPETVRESSVFIYKDYVDTDDNGNKVLKTHPSWRCGPDMKDPR